METDHWTACDAFDYEKGVKKVLLDLTSKHCYNEQSEEAHCWDVYVVVDI